MGLEKIPHVVHLVHRYQKLNNDTAKVFKSREGAVEAAHSTPKTVEGYYQSTFSRQWIELNARSRWMAETVKSQKYQQSDRYHDIKVVFGFGYMLMYDLEDQWIIDGESAWDVSPEDLRAMFIQPIQPPGQAGWRRVPARPRSSACGICCH